MSRPAVEMPSPSKVLDMVHRALKKPLTKKKGIFMTPQERINAFQAASHTQGRNLSADTFRAFVRAAEELPKKMWASPPFGDMVPVTDKRGNEYLIENPEAYPGEPDTQHAPGQPAEWSAEAVWLKIEPGHPDYPSSTDKRVIRDITDFMFDPPDRSEP